MVQSLENNSVLKQITMSLNKFKWIHSPVHVTNINIENMMQIYTHSTRAHCAQRKLKRSNLNVIIHN